MTRTSMATQWATIVPGGRRATDACVCTSRLADGGMRSFGIVARTAPCVGFRFGLIAGRERGRPRRQKSAPEPKSSLAPGVCRRSSRLYAGPASGCWQPTCTTHQVTPAQSCCSSAFPMKSYRAGLGIAQGGLCHADQTRRNEGLRRQADQPACSAHRDQCSGHVGAFPQALSSTQCRSFSGSTSLPYTFAPRK